MALIIEDGSGVPGANSYVTVEEIKTYNNARGTSLPSTDEDIEKLAVQAFDYVESFRSQYQGTKTNPQYPQCWPRTGVVIDGYYEVPSNAIPQELRDASCQATGDAAEQDLMPTQGPAVVKEKVDVLEVQYAEPTQTGGMNPEPAFPKVDSKLEPLFNTGGSGYRVQVIRG